MELFGPFEAGRVLDSGNGATVFEAKKEGDAKGKYVVKLFSPDRLVSEETQQVKSELDPLFKDLGASFTNRVNLQKKAAESSRYFAPILAAGHDQRGAWYATQFYARSVKGMLERIVALEAPDLFHVVNSVVRAALHLKKTSGRSHGNLKASNIFIEGVARPRSSRVVISDPLPGQAGEGSAFERADLRAIGELLYQLVLRRKVDFAWVIVPIESSSEWSRVFGKKTAGWLELCNRLLDPNLSLERTSLESVEQELRRLEPKPPVPIIPIAVGAGVLVLAGLVAFLLLHKGTAGTLVVKTDPPGSRLIVIPVDSDGNEEMGRSLTNVTGLDGVWKHSFEQGPYKLKVEYKSALGDLEPSRRIPIAIEAGKTFRTNLSLPYGGLVVRSEPPNAEFKINAQTYRTPFTNRYARPDTLELQLRLEGFETTNLNITIPPNHAAVEFSALLRKPPPGSSLVEFASDPPGADLFLDGVSIGKTPRSLSVTNGQHQIAAELAPWFERQSRQVDVQKDQGRSQSFYFPHGSLNLTNFTPPVVRIFLNDRVAGNSPTNISVPPGTYTLELRAEGYETNRQSVVVAEKALVSPSAILKGLAGFVELISDPAGAEIRDATNKVLAVTGPDGVARIPLAPGVYSLKVSYGDLSPIERKGIEVKAGQPTKLGQLSLDYGAVSFDVQPPDAQANANILRADQKQVRVGETLYQKPNDNVLYRIAAPGYESEATNVVVASKQTRRIGVRLFRQTVAVKLVGTPPGVKFYSGDAVELKPAGENYLLPWGTMDIVARHPRLGARTNSVTINLSGPNTVPPVQFTYGTLVLTNLPKDITVLEGTATIGTPGDKVAYEPLGAHTYILRGRFRSETVVTNILAGVNFLQSTAPKGVFSGIGMELLQVRELSGAKGEVYVGKFEVTQAEYNKVMSANPSQQPQGDTLPVNNVAAREAEDFCKKLTALDRATPGFPSGYSYVIPTVAQWESLTSGSDPGLGVFSQPSPSPRLTSPSPVGSKGADGNGLCDLYGNVWEICQDPARGGYRMRGGSYNDTAAGFKVVFNDTFSQPSPRIGFRVLLVPPGQ